MKYKSIFILSILLVFPVLFALLTMLTARVTVLHDLGRMV